MVRAVGDGHLGQLLPPLWGLLTGGLAEHERFLMNDGEDEDDGGGDNEEEDGVRNGEDLMFCFLEAFFFSVCFGVLYVRGWGEGRFCAT